MGMDLLYFCSLYFCEGDKVYLYSNARGIVSQSFLKKKILFIRFYSFFVLLKVIL